MTIFKKSLLSITGIASAAIASIGVSTYSNEAEAAPFDCSAAYQVEHTFENGTRWQMCWERVDREGVIYNDVFFTDINGVERKVMDQLTISQIHVPYDDNGARYHDVTDYGLGTDDNLNDLTPADCPGGTLLKDGSKDVICQTVSNLGEGSVTATTVKEREVLSLFSVAHIGAYNYVPDWRFLDDGSIEPTMGATGQLQRYSATESAGWRIQNTGGQPYGVSHIHNYYWKLDFSLGETYSTNDQFEEINFVPNADNTKFEKEVTTFTQETMRSINNEQKRFWRVKSETVTNEDNKVGSYEIVPVETGHRDVGPANEPWTQNDIYATVYRDCERYVSHNPRDTAGGCADQGTVDGFVNGESLTVGNDLVVWFGLTFHHIPRAEDETYMHAHWNHFKIRPRDWTAGVAPTNTAPVVAAVDNQSGFINEPVDVTISATDQEDETITYSASNLPQGLVINASTGQITGSPTVAGTSTVTVTATDGTGASGTSTFVWTVFAANTAPVIDAIDDQTSFTNQSVNVNIVVADEDQSTLTYSATGLPQGLTIDTATGLISGKATIAGTYTVSVTATDSSGLSDTKSFDWVVVFRLIVDTDEDGVPDSVDLYPEDPTRSAGIWREQFDGINGQLTNSVNFPNNPNNVEQVDTFNGPAYLLGDDYGTRIHGIFYAPTTGAYQFFIAADDNATLNLSSDSSPENKVQIANSPDWTNVNQWDKYPEQASATVQLTAGEPYYIEALHNQTVLGDHISVGWTTPTNSSVVVMPTEVFTYVAPVDPDSDGDGVPDSLDAFPNDPNESKDSDQDNVGDNVDAFPYDPYETLDSDGDGVGDNADEFPFDADRSKPDNGDVVYFDAQSGSADAWQVYDQIPAGASITNVFDEERNSRVIELSGTRTLNAYRLGHFAPGNARAWRNDSQTIIQWDARFDNENHTYLISVETTNGQRFIMYTPKDSDDGISSNGRYIRLGIGAEKTNGAWHTIARDLNVDLKKFEPTNEVLEVNGFAVRGSGRIDNIKLLDRLPSITYEDAQDGLISGWSIFDSLPTGATINNVFDSVKNSQVIELSGDSTQNGYRFGHQVASNSNAWANNSQAVIQWDARFDNENHLYLVAIETLGGSRYMTYKPKNVDEGITSNPRYVRLGIGEDKLNGEWHTITRDLNADLKAYEPNNEVVQVNGLLIKGSGRIDNIKMLNLFPSVIYDDLEDGLTERWDVYDRSPSGATITSVFDEAKNSQVVEFSGSGIQNGYRIGYHTSSNAKAWGNSTHQSIQWDSRFDGTHNYTVVIETADGIRYMKYSPSNTDAGISLNGNTISFGLGVDKIDGNWHTIRRNLISDLKKFEENNKLLKVNGLLIRGSGRIDNVKMY